jgi:hypothetical protein
MHGRPRYANRWYCSAAPDSDCDCHDHGDGARPRHRCRCGAVLFTERGRWGVFRAGPDGEPAGPPLTDRRIRTAAANTARAGENLTVSWIPEDDDPGPLPARIPQETPAGP